MRETWPFERETFNYFSDENYSVSIRDRFSLRNQSVYPKNWLTIIEAIQIAEDFKMAERPDHDPLKDWDYEFACPFLWPKFSAKQGL